LRAQKEGTPMRFQSLRSSRPIQYLYKGWKAAALGWRGEHSFVERCLNNQTAVERWFGEGAFLERCLAEQDRIKFYLNTREYLQSFNIEEGTVLFPEEHLFLKGLVETANTLPGPIVEIGTLLGFTTTRFGVWKKPDKKIITVDKYCWNPWGL